MQKRLNQLYASVRRYSAGVFRRHKVAQAFGMEGESLGIEKVAGQAADEISCAELIEYAHRLGFTSSGEALANMFVKANGDKPTMPRADLPKLLRKLLSYEPGKE